MGFFAYDRVYPSQKQMDDALDDFAELLSRDHYSLSEIAGHMSISVGSACVLLHQLCGRYGEEVRL